MQDFDNATRWKRSLGTLQEIITSFKSNFGNNTARFLIANLETSFPPRVRDSFSLLIHDVCNRSDFVDCLTIEQISSNAYIN